MTRQTIATDKAPKAIGPYVQAVKSGDLLFCSGQIPLDPATGQIVGGTIQEQTERVLQNVRGVLAAAGGSLGSIVKATVFLHDMNEFAGMNEVYAKHFPADPPARSTVQVARLPKDAKVEIEVVARI